MLVFLESGTVLLKGIKVDSLDSIFETPFLHSRSQDVRMSRHENQELIIESHGLRMIQYGAYVGYVRGHASSNIKHMVGSMSS